MNRNEVIIRDLRFGGVVAGRVACSEVPAQDDTILHRRKRCHVHHGDFAAAGRVHKCAAGGGSIDGGAGWGAVGGDGGEGVADEHNAVAGKQRALQVELVDGVGLTFLGDLPNRRREDV